MTNFHHIKKFELMVYSTKMFKLMFLNVINYGAFLMDPMFYFLQSTYIRTVFMILSLIQLFLSQFLPQTTWIFLLDGYSSHILKVCCSEAFIQRSILWWSWINTRAGGNKRLESHTGLSATTFTLYSIEEQTENIKFHISNTHTRLRSQLNQKHSGRAVAFLK